MKLPPGDKGTRDNSLSFREASFEAAWQECWIDGGISDGYFGTRDRVLSKTLLLTTENRFLSLHSSFMLHQTDSGDKWRCWFSKETY